VDIYFDPPPVEGDEDILIGKITSVVEKIVGGAEGGDVLVFCTGEKMIKDTVARLLGCKVRRELHVMPLYGRLGSEEQEKVFDPAPQGLTKIVVSTNVAETSVTIDGISAVVDTGLAKMISTTLAPTPAPWWKPASPEPPPTKEKAGRDEPVPEYATGTIRKRATRNVTPSPGGNLQNRPGRSSCSGWRKSASGTLRPSPLSARRTPKASTEPWTPCGFWMPWITKMDSRHRQAHDPLPPHAPPGPDDRRVDPALPRRPSGVIIAAAFCPPNAPFLCPR
jgi:hypothetical protein